MPNHPRRADPAKLYFARFEQAEAQRDVAAAVYFRTQIESYDDGSLADLLRGEAKLSVASDPTGAEVIAFRYVDDAESLRLEPIGTLGRTPLAEVSLPPGTYLLIVRAEGRVETRCPVRLGRQ